MGIQKQTKKSEWILEENHAISNFDTQIKTV